MGQTDPAERHTSVGHQDHHSIMVIFVSQVNNVTMRRSQYVNWPLAQHSFKNCNANHIYWLSVFESKTVGFALKWCLRWLFDFNMYQKPFSAGAPPRTPLGELTTLPRPPNRMGSGTSPPRSSTTSSPPSWRITFKLLPPPPTV